MSIHDPFQVGPYRPIYLWGGPGTIRMNRLKFMNQPVDEDAHHLVHRDEGAGRVLEDLYCNWVHLMYDWGFPPEVEIEDWEDFRRAAEVYHRRGSKVFAYVQTSNCVYDGSYREQDWYALNEHGKKIYYYSGRYMVCLTHPKWIDHLKEIIHGAIERGADGIFFDNMWHGAMPISLFDTWLGAAGCHCEHCQAAYREASGDQIPTEVQADNPQVRHYLRWRAGQTTRLVSDLVAYANELQPGTPVSANDYDIIMRDTYLVYGQDPRALAATKQVTMVENFALPRWDGWGSGRLVNNALTIRNSLPLIGAAHLSVLSYDVGIGFDPLYSARRYQQGIAEAAACGASMTVKGTEYYHAGQHTTLAPAEFTSLQQAIGIYNRWLEANSALFLQRKNAAAIGLLYPPEDVWLNWHRLAPVYMGVGQALLVEGLPWRVVTSTDDLDGLDVLLVFDLAKLDDISTSTDITLVCVPEIAGWELRPESFLARTSLARSIVGRCVHGLMDSYMSSKMIRDLSDRLGLQKLYTQTALFDIPPKEARQALVDALPGGVYPRVKAPEPALIDVWSVDGGQQVHLVNYASRSQSVRVEFDKAVHARILSPDGEGNQVYSGDSLDIPVEIYKVLLIED